jgi:hypothetical protein
MKRIALVIGFVVVNTVPRWVHGIDGDIFCMFQALSYVLLCLAALLSIKDRRERIVWDWACLLAINNFIDEMYRVAEKTNVFEVSFAIAITAWTVIRLIKCRTNKNN